LDQRDRLKFFLKEFMIYEQVARTVFQQPLIPLVLGQLFKPKEKTFENFKGFFY